LLGEHRDKSPLLTRYPTALRLSKAKAKSVARIPYVSKERAQQLVATAKKSVASASDQITEQLIGATVKQILDLNKTIKTQTQILADECVVPEVELLKTFIGIGDYSAIGLMLEIQSVKRFLTSKKLSSFFGILEISHEQKRTQRTASDPVSGGHVRH